MIALRMQTRRPRLLGTGHANAGVSAAYEKRLRTLVQRMCREVDAEIKKYAGAAAKEVAQDANPLTALRYALAALTKKWQRVFADESEGLASRFVWTSADDMDRNLKARLRKLGFGIRFAPDANMRRVLKIAIAENTSLIKSIPEKYATQVTSMVSNAVMTGGDLHTLSQGLIHRFGVTERRAAFISQDQSHKIAETAQRLRCEGLGLYKQRWRHPMGEKQPRPLHVEAGRKGLIFDIREGALIDGKRIWPGSEPGCKCRGDPIIPGYDD